MIKIKIVDLLKSLPDDEMKLLDKFVSSPIHNKHSLVVSLFRYLRKELKHAPEAISVENMFEVLFPNELFNAQKVHHISSYLLKVVDEFLAWNEWRNNEHHFKMSLLHSYQRLQLFPEFEKAHKKQKKAFLSAQRIDSGYMRGLYMLEMARFEQDRVVNSSSKLAFNLQELTDRHDLAFIAEKLRIGCILLSNQAVVKTNYSTGLLDKILEYVEEHQLYEKPAIAVYYLAIQTIINQEDDRSFQKLKKLLIGHQTSFNVKELHDVYIFSINYCIRRFNSGEKAFMREVFEIYKLGMKSQAFLQNGVMSPRTYSNVVMSGLRAKEHKWIEQFIFEYKAALPEKQREGFFNYNSARFHYDKGNYTKAMPLLQMMEYEDVLLTCLGKILLSKMQYELNEWDALFSQLQSFKAYLRRKKMLGYHKESCTNFIHFTNKLATGKFSNSKNLEEEILSTKVISEKEWLIEQAKAIKKNARH